jgi:hypothetical protein
VAASMKLRLALLGLLNMGFLLLTLGLNLIEVGRWQHCQLPRIRHYRLSAREGMEGSHCLMSHHLLPGMVFCHCVFNACAFSTNWAFDFADKSPTGWL